jgi:hypothetical protein
VVALAAMELQVPVLVARQGVVVEPVVVALAQYRLILEVAMEVFRQLST